MYNVEVEGNHCYRVGESGVLVNNMSTGPIAAPAISTGCCPQVNTATPTQFELINPSKTSNFILGEVVAGELTFVVENLPKTTPTTGCTGRWMFAQMMDPFQSVGTTITAVVGSWTYGDNLAAINRLTDGANGISLRDAAKQTITGSYADSRQYTNVTVSSATGTPGNYTKVRVLFTR